MLRNNDDHFNNKTTAADVKCAKDADQCEMSIVETMHKIRQILWPPHEGVPSDLFSDEGSSKEVNDLCECFTWLVHQILRTRYC